ncbi:MAG: zf-HC2 domain-containing protein [Acidimicrobiia bacterium]
MDCHHAQALVSAGLDGELSEAEQAAATAHIATCPACRAFVADAELVQRIARVAPAPPVPDLTAAILAALPAPPAAPARDRAVRLGLVGAAVLLMLLALPSLLTTGHATHEQHLASFDIALAVGFVWVAARPARALSGFLPIGTVLVGSCVLLAALDAAAGRGDNLRLVTHGIAVLGMIATWTLIAQTHRRPSGDEIALAA